MKVLSMCGGRRCSKGASLHCGADRDWKSPLSVAIATWTQARSAKPSDGCVRVAATVAALAKVCALVLLAGCAENHDVAELEAFMQAARSQPAPRSHESPEIISPVAESAHHEPADRDPFAPSPLMPAGGATQNTASPEPDPLRPKQPLERFAISALAMTGTLSAGAGRFGLVRDGNGFVHRVAVGNYLGQNHGRIQEISPSTIEIVEIVPDGAEGWARRTRSLSLGRSEAPLGETK